MKNSILKLRTLCFFLMLILILSCIPVGAFEEENSVIPADVVDSNVEIEDAIEYDEPIDDNIIVNVTEPTEIVARRDRNVKHYLMPDGKMQAIVHAKAIHRKDENGKWQDIDNSLYTVDNGVSSKFATKDNRVVFAKSYTKDQPLLTLSENGYSISMSHISDSTVSNDHITRAANVDLTSKAATVKNTSTELVPIEDVKQIYSRSSVTYSINSTVDIEYLLDGDDVKENILISSPQTDYTYTFKLELDGLYAELHDDGYVNIFDSETNERQYVIPAPFMFDKSGAFSDDVYYTLTQSGDDYILSVVADSEWANSEERVFPITIDPSIEVSFSKDLYIDAANQYVNYGESTELIVGENKIAFFDFDYDWPTQYQIYSSEFNVSYYFDNSVNSGSLELGLYPILYYWEEDTWTWRVAQVFQNSGISTSETDSKIIYGTTGAYQSSPKWVRFDITELALDWQSKSSVSYGIALKWKSGMNNMVSLNSTEGLPAYAPYLTVTYGEPYISNGVYKIRNAVNQMCLTVNGDGSESEASVHQYVDVSGIYYPQLFKIKYVGFNLETCNNVYTIRPMVNSGWGLYARYLSDDNTRVYTKPMSTIDSISIGAFQCWAIYESGSNYILQNNDEETATYLATNPSNNDLGANISMLDIETQHREWILEKYSVSCDEIIFTEYPPERMIWGETGYIKAYMRSSQPGVNGPVKYSTNNPHAIDITSSNGKITAINAVDSNIVYATYIGAPQNWEFNISVEINYLIRINADYITSNIESLTLNNINGYQNQVWMLMYQSNGYYVIRNEFENKFLAYSLDVVNQPNPTLETMASVQNIERLYWKIIRNADGTFLIQSKSNEQNSSNIYLGIVEENIMETSNVSDIKWHFSYMKSTDAPLEGQKWDNWCWAASARMVARQLGTVLSSRTQEAAVRAIKGSVTNETGGKTAVKKAIGYYLYGNTDSMLDRLFGAEYLIYDENTLRRFIDDNYSLYISRGKYVDGKYDSGHAYVVFGYTKEIINGEVQFKYLLRDPWPEDPPTPWAEPIYTNGVTHLWTYSFLCNEYDEDAIWAWDSIVVMNTEYAQNTIPYMYQD